jgi:hypothetical protein
VVPSTTFVRHDYSELFPFVPNDEAHGRNYASKLGFFLVHSEGERTVSSWVRTFGHVDPTTAVASIALPATNLFRGERAALGVDLRHDWATPRPIPYTALQDEFNRKRIRNDYFTASLIETGIARLRVPLQDLEETPSSRRMSDLARLGVKFVVFMYDAPTASDVALLNRDAKLIELLEICAPRERMSNIQGLLRERGLDKRIRVAFSEMGTSAAGVEAMAHYIWTGFDGARPDLREYLEEARSRGFSSAVVRIERSIATAVRLNEIARMADAVGIHSIVYVRLASTNGAEPLTDDDANARLVAMLELMGRVHAARMTIIVDTYADHDRGYYPRTGFVDRAYDLRKAGIVVARLTGILTSAEPSEVEIKGDKIAFEVDGWRFALFTDGRLPDEGSEWTGFYDLSTFGEAVSVPTRKQRTGNPILAFTDRTSRS